jgi:hypothetical protein
MTFNLTKFTNENKYFNESGKKGEQCPYAFWAVFDKQQPTKT